MPAPYTSATFSNAYEYKRRKIAYPIRNDPSLGFVVTRFYEVVESSFSAPALDAVDAEFTNAYVVAVRDRAHRDGELMQYEVDFASIPARREFDIEGFSGRFPGLAATTTPAAAKVVQGFVPSADRQSAILHVPSHGATAQRACGYHLVLTAGADRRSAPFSLQGHALIVASSTHALTLSLATPVPAGVPVGFVAGTVRTFDIAFPARGELTEDVTARAVCDYFLPGVTTGIATAADIPLPPRFRVFDSTGAETATLSTTTHPTQATYEAMILGGHEILLQPSLTRWRGNIWERVLRFAKSR